MLSKLFIKNIAVIQKAELDFAAGLNVFTGETGAGKTILIAAIQAVLGERTSREIIRTGEDKAVVTALFEDISPRAAEKLRELGYEDDEGALLVSREITQAGKTSCKLNGMPATVAILKEISQLLIHIHGQHDSGQLLQSENHLAMLDSFGGLGPGLESYRAAWREMRAIRAELDALEMDDAQKAQRVDMLEFQLREIDTANLSDPDEEESLLARRKMIRNAEKILSALSLAYDSLTGGDEGGGMNGRFDDFRDGVQAAADYIDGLAPMASRAAEIGYELEEFAADLRAILDDFEFDPRELDEIERRADTIYKLKRKYGSSIGEILVYAEKIRAELENITTAEERREKLTVRLQAADREVAELAGALTDARKETADRFCAMVREELAFLDMPSVQLSVRCDPKPFAENGADDVELLIVTNVGEEPKPLAKIASGGEIARIMLAIKSVLAGRDDIDTLVFDEVDTGVSGRAAQKIGRKLREVARSRQVLCVTHLAQVAAFANLHLLIRKEVLENRTFTRIAALSEDEAVDELARITSGDNVTELARASARELWESARE